MSQDEAKRSLRLIKQRINEGAAGVRDQRDRTLPLLDERLAGQLRGAIQSYNEACKATKEAIDGIIASLEPQPVTRLPLELSYPKLRASDGSHIGVCAALVPSLLFNHAIDDADLADWLDWLCALRAGNQIRAFAWGGWEPHTWDWILTPYQKRGDLYDLDKWNEDFWNMFDRRLAMIADRNLTCIVSLNDNCSIHDRRTGYWAWSWWNGCNNRNGTATEPAAMYHWYEEHNQHRPGWPELGEYLRHFYDHAIKVTMRYWPFVKIELGNEVRAAQLWHEMMASFAEPYRPEGWSHFPKYSLQSSIEKADYAWLREKRLEAVCIQSIHGCCDAWKMLSMINTYGKPGVKYIASQDGCYPTSTPEATRSFVREVLKAGHDVELNLRPHFALVGGEWTGRYQRTDWTFRRMMHDSEPWMRAAATGWQEAL
ncbi:MAG: hypothetical protein JRH08_11610 [Deltaproteobacteria bacterium]|nr:hypothetical protein [Deltaproteobacteria bacterium]